MKNKIKTSLVILWAALLCSCSPTGTPADSSASQGPDYRKSNADVVVLSFFDMYCPHCQRSAPDVNQLHAMVQRRGMGGRIAFYAIGRNNTPMEAEMYRKRFNVTYPVLADRDRAISSRFGDFLPPMLIALKKKEGRWQEFYRESKIQGKADQIYRHIQP